MQRFYEVRRDQFGNPAAGLTCSVYATGTSNLSTLYIASSTSDTSGTIIANPVVTGADGIVAFAIADGDYDMVFLGADGATETRIRVNFFDSTTSTTIPVSSISLSMPAEFSVAGSPGTSLTVTKATETANTVWAGPTSGGVAQPAFRALVTADVSPVGVTLTGDQTAAGVKTWSGNAVFSGTTTVAGAATFTTTVSVGGTTSMTGNLIMAKAAKYQVDTSSASYPWKSIPFQITGDGTGKFNVTTMTSAWNNIYLPMFDPDTNNYESLICELPADYEAGTDIYLYVNWAPKTTDTGNCRWGWEYSIIKNYSQGTFPASTVIYTLTAGSGTANKLQQSESTVITGTNFEPGTVIACMLFRDASNGVDGMTCGAFYLGAGVKYQASRLGSKNRNIPFYS